MKPYMLLVLALVACNSPRAPRPGAVDSTQFPSDSTYEAEDAKTDSILDLKDSLRADSVRADSAQSGRTDTTAPRVAMEDSRMSLVSKPKMTTSQTNTDSTVVVKYNSTVTPLKGDTIRVTFARSKPTGEKSQTQKSINRTGQLTFKTPRVSGKASYYACSYFMRKKTELHHHCVGWDKTLSAPVDPTLAVVGVDIKPDTATVEIKKEQQFCGFIEFANGKLAMRTQDADLCTKEYAKLPLPKRVVSTAQQAVADKVCLKWTATGGTITVEPCPAPAAGTPS